MEKRVFVATRNFQRDLQVLSIFEENGIEPFYVQTDLENNYEVYQTIRKPVVILEMNNDGKYTIEFFKESKGSLVCIKYLAVGGDCDPLLNVKKFCEAYENAAHPRAMLEALEQLAYWTHSLNTFLNETLGENRSIYVKHALLVNEIKEFSEFSKALFHKYSSIFPTILIKSKYRKQTDFDVILERFSDSVFHFEKVCVGNEPSTTVIVGKDVYEETFYNVRKLCSWYRKRNKE